MKKKYKIKWKNVILAALCLILFLYLIISLLISLFSGSNKDVDIYKIADFSGNKTLQIINSEDRSNSIEVKDYSFYGESLDLYFSNYSLSMPKSDTLNGKTVVLKDLIDDKNIITFENLTNEIDNQIKLDELKDGFYSIYLQNGEVLSRLFYSSVLSYDNVFYTVRRDGQIKKIELIADKSLFDYQKKKETVNVLDNNYLYLKVSTVAADQSSQYDIAISTAPALVYEGVSLTGVEDNGIVESEQLYQLALDIKAQLESKGLKVLLIKDTHDQDIAFYGNGGVLNKAYSSKAKLFIHLDMDEYGDKAVLYSSKSSSQLANAIFNGLLNDCNIYENDQYLLASSLTEDGNNDAQFEIREAGGKLLAAATYSENSQNNKSFAYDNRYGMNAVDVILTNINEADDVANFLNNKDKIVTSIVSGICSYLNIK